MNCKTFDEPSSDQSLNLSINEISVSAWTRSSKRAPPISNDQLFFIPFLSPRYLKVVVRARLFKSSCRPERLSFLSLSLFTHSHSTFLLFVHRTRNTRALRNRATPAAGQPWMSDSRRLAACVRDTVACVQSPLATCAIHAHAPHTCLRVIYTTREIYFHPFAHRFRWETRKFSRV